MNELLFIIHTFLIALFSLGSLALGCHALIAFICIQCILANFFVIKQITLCGMTATCSDVFTIGATLSLNVLQEYFGKEITKKTILTTFFLLIFYAIMSKIHLLYIPHNTDTTQQHFLVLLHHTPRIISASLFAYLIAQYTDYHLYGFLKKLYKSNYIIIRNYSSILLSQLLDTILFSFFGLYGIVDNIWPIIIVSYSIKVAAIIFAVPFISISRWIYQQPTETKLE